MKVKSRAIIYVNNKLVLIKRTKGNEEYYVFPGGSVEQGETNEEACIRELKEELGIEAVIDNLVFEYSDYIGNIKEVFYTCTIVGGNIESGVDEKFIKGTEKSVGYEIVYIDKNEAKILNVLPLTVRDKVLL